MQKSANPPDYVFLGLIGALVIFGFIVLSSASSIVAYEKFGSSFYLVKHQLLLGLLPGVLFFLAMLHIPYSTWRKLAPLVFIFTILLLVFVIIPGIGRKFGGSRSWFTIGSFSFQPSEFAKLAIIIYLSAWFETKKGELKDLKKGFLPFILIIGGIGLLLILQPDLGTLSIISAIVFFMAFVSGMRLKHLGGAVLAGIALFGVLIKIAPYRVARLASFIHPELDPQGIGYHINQALLAIGSGGLFGVGLGNSRQKFRYLPEVTGDSIFPIIAEELGFIISAGFIILFMVIIWRMFKIAMKAPDEFSKFVVIGAIAWFGIQTFVNIAAMVGFLPLTGLPLPFVSYGGTALAIELGAVGLVANISKYAK